MKKSISIVALFCVTISLCAMEADKTEHESLKEFIESKSVSWVIRQIDKHKNLSLLKKLESLPEYLEHTKTFYSRRYKGLETPPDKLEDALLAQWVNEMEKSHLKRSNSDSDCLEDYFTPKDPTISILNIETGTTVTVLPPNSTSNKTVRIWQKKTFEKRMEELQKNDKNSHSNISKD